MLRTAEFSLVRRECSQYVELVANKSLSNNLEHAKDQEDLINQLYKLPYVCNWINIRMLENISGVSQVVNEDIKQYKEAVFCGNLVDKIFDIGNYEVPEDNFIEIEEKWKRNISAITIQDFIEHWIYIEKILLKKRRLLLYKITARDVWVEIVWLLCNRVKLVADAVESATNNDLCGQLSSDVFHLTIGNHVIRNLDPSKWFGIIL